MKLLPLGKKVVVELIEAPNMTKGGLHIPECARHTQQERGRVVALGGAVITSLNRGQTVVFQKYAGVEVFDEDTKKKYRILNLKEVLAVVE